jgi:hypothetical protein
MAETTGTTQTQRTANARKGSTRRSTAATKRSTAAKKAAQTRAAKTGTTARRRTSAAAKSRATTAQSSTARQTRQTEYTVQALAERAVLTYVGAALTARDNVIGTVDELRTKYGTRSKAERKLETQLNKFERRGERARRNAEREVKRTRTRVERELRQRRTRVQRQVRPLVRDARSQSGLAGAQAENLGAQLQNVFQTGVTAGTELAAKVQERVAALV